MKIAHVVHSLHTGGMERLVVDMAIRQKEAGHKVDIFCITTQKGIFETEVSEAGIGLTEFNKKDGFNPGLVMKMSNIFRHDRYDVIHTHNPVPNFYGSIAGRISGIKKIINTSHGMGNFRSSNLRDKTFKFSSMLVNKSVFVCREAEERFLRDKLVSRRKAAVVYNGIPLEKFLDVNGTQTPKENDSFIVGTVARLEQAKNVEMLVRAVPLILKKVPNLKVVIVGSGSLEEKLKKTASEIGVSDAIDFLGTRNDVNMRIKSFDVFTLTSLSEGVSLTIIEAMAAGKPVIATRVGGNPEVVSDGETGYIVPSGDIEKLTEKVVFLSENKDKAVELGENGIKRAKEYFDIDVMVKAYLKLYGEK